jgi:hypothetical protein
MPPPRLPDFDPVAPDEVQTLAHDFGNLLPSGVSLTGTPTVTITVHSGTDPAPQDRLVANTPQIGTVGASLPLAGSGVPSAAVLFQFSGGVAGTIYVVETRCARSDGDTIVGWNRLPCIAPS